MAHFAVVAALVSLVPFGVVLRLCGELDRDTRNLIAPTVLAAIPTANKIVFDLADLTFCDSTGLSTFVSAARTLKPKATR